MDALWSILCLSLFYYKLRELIFAMRELTMSDVITTRYPSSKMSTTKISSSKISFSTKLSTSPPTKRLSTHESKPTPTKIIARASKLQNAQIGSNIKPNAFKHSKITPIAAGIHTITERPTLESVVSPYKDTSSQCPNTSMIAVPSKSITSNPGSPGPPPSAESTPAPSFSPEPTPFTPKSPDSKHQLIAKELSYPSPQATPQPNQKVLKLSLADKSTPSMESTPNPFIQPPDFAMNLSDSHNPTTKRETKVRFSICLDKSPPASEETMDDEDHSLSHRMTSDRSVLPSILQDEEWGTGIKEEVDNDGMVIVFDDEDEDEIPVRPTRMNKLGSVSSHTHTTKMELKEIQDDEEEKHTMDDITIVTDDGNENENERKLDDPSTLRRCLSDTMESDLPSTTNNSLKPHQV